MLEFERKEVAAAARALAAQGLLTGTAGNISTRSGQLVAITPTGVRLETLGPEQVAVVDLAGEHVDGYLEASSELELHLGVYDRYGAGAVVHAHAPMATALSCVLSELPCIHYEMLPLGGSVRVAPYATVGTPEFAFATVSALDSRTAALMANHGAITQGFDLDDAVANMELLERSCALYSRAAAVGVPRALDDDQQRAVLEAATARHYGTPQPVAVGTLQPLAAR